MLYQYTTQGIAGRSVLNLRASVLRLPALGMFVELVSSVCECESRNRNG